MRALMVMGWCWAAVAGAWPVDWAHDVAPGHEKFVPLPQVDWFENDAPDTVSAEWVSGAHELVLIGKKPGRALLLLGAQGKVAVWRVRVGTPPVQNDAVLKAAQKACPDMALTPLEAVKLKVTVQNDSCRRALSALFETDAFEARHLELTFEGEVLQEQLKGLQAALKPVAPGVEAAYVGAGLVLTGEVSEAGKRKMLWTILRSTLGRFALDDRTHGPHSAP